MANGVDLSLLPAPEVIDDISFEAVLADMKADLVARHPDIATVIALESEPAVKILEVAAYRETLLRSRYNDEARALLLAHATGADLDHIGTTYYQEARLLVSAGNPDADPPTLDVWEADDAYRNRLALKPESYSVAGPTDAYTFHALSASGQVKSVSVSSPQPGTTLIYVLSQTGSGIPDAGLLATVAAALNPGTVRPLSEEVLVQAATVVDYAIDVDLVLFPGPSTEPVLAAAEAALAQLAAAYHVLGADPAYSAFAAAAHRPGVKRAIINSPPAGIVCGPGEAPYCTAIAVRIAGVEE
ncbi:MAG: baseplate assembly protein [Rhodocyclaceae bacterium]|nr:baseplate assembly protein [Rhodocyclaceae bacterium]